MIQFDHVIKSYPTGQLALDDISFQVEPGEMVFVTGHSGAGKSTLLKLIACMEKPTHGTVMMAGTDLSRLRHGKVPALRQQLGMVFQNHRLLMDRSVYDNVELPLVIAGMGRADRVRRVRSALQRVGLLGYEKQPPVTLSTGEQQRVGIARAIVSKPVVLIADEPTGNLDPDLAREIMNLFAEFQRVGTTVLVASHDLVLIKNMRQRVLVLDHGRLVDDVPAREVA